MNVEKLASIAKVFETRNRLARPPSFDLEERNAGNEHQKWKNVIINRAGGGGRTCKIAIITEFILGTARARARFDVTATRRSLVPGKAGIG